MPDYCEVALPVPLDKHFTYSVPDSLAVRPGMRVIVPFGSRQLAGVVVRCGPPPAGLEATTIKPLKTVLDIVLRRRSRFLVCVLDVVL